MTLPMPHLDDRRFQGLVDDAKRLIAARCPEWSDHNVSDPGVTLIEAFAFMTDELVYRLNRVPDKLYIAFVAEFSRGKSELINAIFFAGFGARILPSSAGRTTMCPTELQYDSGQEPQLRLLPIETRKSGTTIAEYKGFPEEWQAFMLDTKSPESMTQVLSQITQVKHVSREEAQTLGLHVAEEETEIGMRIADPGLETAAMARSQGAVGTGPVTKPGDLQPAIEEGVETSQKGGLCMLDPRVLPGTMRTGDQLMEPGTFVCDSFCEMNVCVPLNQCR